MAVFVCVLKGVQAWQVGRKTKRNFNCFAQAIKMALIHFRHSPGIAPTRRTISLNPYNLRRLVAGKKQQKAEKHPKLLDFENFCSAARSRRRTLGRRPLRKNIHDERFNPSK